MDELDDGVYLVLVWVLRAVVEARLAGHLLILLLQLLSRIPNLR